MAASLVHRDISEPIAGAFTALAVDGELYAGSRDDNIIKKLLELSVIEANPNSRYLHYTAVKELGDMLEPYQQLIAMMKQVRGYWLMFPSMQAAELIRDFSRQIGYPLAASWKLYILRREVDPNTKPYYSPFTPDPPR